MIRIYFDGTSSLSARVKERLLINKVMFEDVLDICSRPLFYVGKLGNQPKNILIIKSIIDVVDFSEIGQVPFNSLACSSDCHEGELDLIVKRLESFFCFSEKIQDKYSTMIHDLMGDINHASGYAQLIKISSKDEAINDNCRTIVEASSKIDEKIQEFRKEFFKDVFSLEFSKNYK